MGVMPALADALRVRSPGERTSNHLRMSSGRWCEAMRDGIIARNSSKSRLLLPSTSNSEKRDAALCVSSVISRRSSARSVFGNASSDSLVCLCGFILNKLAGASREP